MSIYVLNIATMLGLALAIDYSLFIVSRFREELRPRPDGRRGGREGRRARRQGRRLLRARRRDRPVRAAAVPGAAISLDRASAGSIVVVRSVFFALTFLPAVLGMLGPRVNAPQPARPARPRLASAATGGEPRPRRRRAGSGWPTGHAPPGRGPRPDARRSCSSSARRSSASSRACPTRRSTRPGSRAATRRSRPGHEFPSGRDDPDRRSSSTVDGDPTDRGQRPGDPGRLRAAARRGRGHRPRRGPVHDPARSGDRRADRRPTRSPRSTPRRPGRCRPSSRPRSTRLQEAYIRGSTVRLDAISPLDAGDAGGHGASSRAIRAIAAR